MEMTDSKELLEAQAHIWNHTYNYMTSMALRCAVQLGIPDIISDHGDRPVTLSELVTQLSIPQTKSNQLYRLMRLLVHSDFFVVKKDDQGREGYTSTYSCKLLSKKQQGSPVPNILLSTDSTLIMPCLSIADWFRGSDSTPFETVHGTNLYDYFGKHTEVGKKFDEAMTNHSELMIRPLLKALKPMLEVFESLVDVGGGTGIVAKVISEELPRLKYTIYDLPHVISGVKDLDNIALVCGDMFEFIPSADIILFKDVLLGSSNEECLNILKRCREAISRENNGGKVIIVETYGRMGDLESSLKFDVFLMTCLTGTERIESEWEKIFTDAGFTSYKMTSIQGLSSIIEVFPKID